MGRISTDFKNFAVSKYPQEAVAADIFAAWLDVSLERSKIERITKREWQHRRRLVRTSASEFLDVRDVDSRPSLSRYDVEAALLGPESAGYNSDEINAVNVLSICPGQLKPVALRLLYLLHESVGTQMSISELMLRLRSHGYEYADIEIARTQLIRIGKRLIFSGLHDETETLEAWINESRRSVSLSTAGRRYVEDLIVSPAYIQWALTEHDQVQTSFRREINSERWRGVGIRGSEQILGRLLAALTGMRELVDVEYRKLSALFEEHKGHAREFLNSSELRCQSAAGDLLLRSSGSFLSTLAVHSRKLARRGDRHTWEAALELARDWVNACRETTGKHRELFGVSVRSWDECCVFGDRDLKQMQEYSRRGSSRQPGTFK